MTRLQRDTSIGRKSGVRILITLRGGGVTEENIRLGSISTKSGFFYVHLEKLFTRINNCLHAVESVTTLPSLPSLPLPRRSHTLICYLRAYQQMIIALLRTYSTDICLNHFLVSPSTPGILL